MAGPNGADIAQRRALRREFTRDILYWSLVVAGGSPDFVANRRSRNGASRRERCRDITADWVCNAVDVARNEKSTAPKIAVRNCRLAMITPRETRVDDLGQQQSRHKENDYSAGFTRTASMFSLD